MGSVVLRRVKPIGRNASDLEQARTIEVGYERRLNWFRNEQIVRETIDQVAPLLLALLGDPPKLTGRLIEAQTIVRTTKSLADEALRPYEQALMKAIGPEPTVQER